MTVPCSIDGCDRVAHARTWCGTHYARWKRLGTVELTPYVTPPCSVDGCDSTSYSNGLCIAHYSRMRKYGTTDLPRTPTTRERFDASHIEDQNGCWIWQRPPGRNGYGRLSIDNRPTYAHRVAWELHRGPIPEGLTIDHLCRVRLCVNPDHLEPVTLAENALRAAQFRHHGITTPIPARTNA